MIDIGHDAEDTSRGGTITAYALLKILNGLKRNKSALNVGAFTFIVQFGG